nr:ABC transporter ATP-binding protein [Sphaerisporangium corydalis]
MSDHVIEPGGVVCDPVIELDQVVRDHGSPPVRAVDHVSLSVGRGEFVAIVGPSGSGKSTLLNIIGTLDRPTGGRTIIDGHDVGAMSDAALSALRAYRIGFVFQRFHLADGVSAVGNVADGLLYTGTPRAERLRRAVASLTRVGLAHRLGHRPHQLSGGERQRVAIARATVSDPALLLADEPTGNLDQRSGAGLMDLLHELNAAGTTIVMITHDVALARQAPRRITIRDGRVVGDDRGAPA